jgi:hypothetical protein
MHARRLRPTDSRERASFMGIRPRNRQAEALAAHPGTHTGTGCHRAPGTGHRAPGTGGGTPKKPPRSKDSTGISATSPNGGPPPLQTGQQQRRPGNSSRHSAGNGPSQP